MESADEAFLLRVWPGRKGRKETRPLLPSVWDADEWLMSSDQSSPRTGSSHGSPWLTGRWSFSTCTNHNASRWELSEVDERCCHRSALCGSFQTIEVPTPSQIARDAPHSSGSSSQHFPFPPISLLRRRVSSNVYLPDRDEPLRLPRMGTPGRHMRRSLGFWAHRTHSLLSCGDRTGH